MTSFTDITPPRHRCACSMACPSVFRSEDGKVYRVTGGYVIDGDTWGTEATVEISAEVLEGALQEAAHRWHEIADQRAARIIELEARLEIDHYYQWDAQANDAVRVEVPPEEREIGSGYGIDCRDETIRLQNEQIEKLRAKVTELETHLRAAGDLTSNV